MASPISLSSQQLSGALVQGVLALRGRTSLIESTQRRLEAYPCAFSDMNRTPKTFPYLLHSLYHT